MPINCIVCNSNIPFYHKIYRCYDSNVCSESCIYRREVAIKKYDPNLEFPYLWNNIRYTYVLKNNLHP